ncbi:MAG: phage holin, LLH family [Clostridiaceae bacterium]|nr:phage holin, LLH family [Clostridiaceae bacterium]
MSGAVISYIAAAFAYAGLYILTLFIRTKVKSEKLDIFRKWVRTGVLSAEQLFPQSRSGARKKAYVMTFIEDKTCGFAQEEVDALIEAAVYCLNMEMWDR